jgi:hypothetical protein
MSEVGKITGWLDGGGPPERRQRPGRASSGTTIACRPFLWPRIGRREGLAQVGKGQTSPPPSPVAARARSAANVFAVLREALA